MKEEEIVQSVEGVVREGEIVNKVGERGLREVEIGERVLREEEIVERKRDC